MKCQEETNSTAKDMLLQNSFKIFVDKSTNTELTFDENNNNNQFESDKKMKVINDAKASHDIPKNVSPKSKTINFNFKQFKVGSVCYIFQIKIFLNSVMFL